MAAIAFALVAWAALLFGKYLFLIPYKIFFQDCSMGWTWNKLSENGTFFENVENFLALNNGIVFYC